VPRTIANESVFAKVKAHNERNARTSNHEIAVLTPATFILTATMSTLARGRTAMNPGETALWTKSPSLEKCLTNGQGKHHRHNNDRKQQALSTLAMLPQ
jgi:hypothetical protein